MHLFIYFIPTPCPFLPQQGTVLAYGERERREEGEKGGGGETERGRWRDKAIVRWRDGEMEKRRDSQMMERSVGGGGGSIPTVDK
jgi:hypothetical protein